ncbi:Gldg family protein [uncultured Parvibaculum sp.]|uniref:GldG family protein n=1 Tax=uncultured Parvibaculum sp. TaxID=291828 RepID=UPI0030EB7209|tara:strand:- start:1663 stop:3612 length:1950 start_codon:yes stop_codon:yes gene_type:complete
MFNQQISRSAYRIVMLVLLAVLFLAVNLFSNIVFRSARIDLTENRLYTLSEGTGEVVGQIEEPITLRFFYSERLANDYPRIRTYATHVRDLLEEIRNRSNGQLRLEVIEPEPFSEQEDLAMSLGLKGAPTAGGDIIYFGLVGTNAVDGLEAIPFFTDEREQYLEYDIARMIQNLSRPTRPVLGIVTNLPLDTGTGGLMSAMRGESLPFMIYEELRDRFELEYLEQQFQVVPEKVEVLMIAHPRELDPATLYAVDQFVMRGGRVLAFIDPHSEVSLTAGPDGQPIRGYSEASNLEPLLKSWGVDYDPTKIVGDRGLAQRVQTGLDARRQESDYVIWLAVQRDNVDAEDIVTADVMRLNLGTVGALAPSEGATTHFTPLVRSSDDAQLYDLDYVKSGPRPDDLLRRFEPTGARYVIAARLSGPVTSAFDGPPDVELEAPEGAASPRRSLSKPGPHLARSEGEANIILFADSDIFDDRFWVQTQSYLGERVAQPIADNASFVVSAIDNLMGSNELISLRARARIDRPFTVVDDLRRTAERRFLAEQEALERRISETERRLIELQTEGAAGLPEDAAAEARVETEIQAFRAELLDSRKKLRDVQRNLRREIDGLGAQLRFINVGLVPLLIAVIALGAAILRYRRRKARAEKGA